MGEARSEFSHYSSLPSVERSPNGLARSRVLYEQSERFEQWPFNRLSIQDAASVRKEKLFSKVLKHWPSKDVAGQRRILLLYIKCSEPAS